MGSFLFGLVVSWQTIVLLAGISSSICAILAAVYSLMNRRKYRREKRWLDLLEAAKNVLYITRDPTLLSNVPGSELEKLSLISIGDVLEGPVHAIAAKLANLTEILLETTELIQSAEGSDKRACVDILSDILLQHGSLNSRKWVSDIIRKLEANGYTTLAVLDPKLHEPKESQALLSLFDGEIEISEREVEGTTRQLLRVRRMYDTHYDPEWVQFS